MSISNSAKVRLAAFFLGGVGSIVAAISALFVVHQPWHFYLHLILGFLGVISAIKATYAKLYCQFLVIVLVLLAILGYIFEGSPYFATFTLSEDIAHLIYAAALVYFAFFLKLSSNQ